MPPAAIFAGLTALVLYVWACLLIAKLFSKRIAEERGNPMDSL